MDIFRNVDARIISLMVMCPACGEAHTLTGQQVYFTTFAFCEDEYVGGYRISVCFTCPKTRTYTRIEDI